MLSAEQVREHSEVSLGRAEPLGEFDKLKLYNGEREGLPDFTRSMARILYIHNEHASKLRIICPLTETISYSKMRESTEEDIKDTIDWKEFTEWINKHDDLTEDNLVTPEVFSSCQFEYYQKGKTGRDGILDTVRHKVINCNKVALV